MIRHELLAYALAHLVATGDLSPDDDTVAMDLLLEYGDECGIPVPAGDEYQRAVLHHFDPGRVPDFPLDDDLADDLTTDPETFAQRAKKD